MGLLGKVAKATSPLAHAVKPLAKPLAPVAKAVNPVAAAASKGKAGGMGAVLKRAAPPAKKKTLAEIVSGQAKKKGLAGVFLR